MSSAALPATRQLVGVLRDQLATRGDPLQLLVGVGAEPPPDATTANAYANVTIGGRTIQIPKLKDAAQPAVGGPAYVLAGRDFLLYLGTVSLIP